MIRHQGSAVYGLYKPEFTNVTIASINSGGVFLCSSKLDTLKKFLSLYFCVGIIPWCYIGPTFLCWFFNVLSLSKHIREMHDSGNCLKDKL